MSEARTAERGGGVRQAPRPLPQIDGIKPYKAGQTLAGAFKLSSNENPLGCSGEAREALLAASGSLEIYPDAACSALRAAIGERYGIDAARIVCGAGSDEIFQLLGRAYLGAGDEIVQSEHGFLVYRLVAQQSGAVVRNAPDIDFTANIDAMIAAVTDRTRIVFLANPNNPTGTYVPFSEVKRLHAALPPEVLLVLDGAYAEYMQANDYSAGLELAAEAPNVVMTRTFSKIHGLAALRVGWAFGPAPVIEALNKVRGPFNVSALSQAAAIAAISDDSFVSASRDHNSAELARVAGGIEALGLKVTPSVCNFVLVHFSESGPHSAANADAALREGGIVVRRMEAYGIPDALRVSIGTEAANTAFLGALSQFLQA